MIALGSPDRAPFERPPAAGEADSFARRARTAIRARELEVDFARAQLLSKLGALVWTSFAFYDVLQASRPDVGHLAELLALRGAGTLMLVAMALRAHRQRPTRFRIEAGMSFSGVFLSFLLSLMCLYDGGFTSMYNPGIVLVTFAMISVPRPFRRGLRMSYMVFLPYTLVMCTAAALSPKYAAMLQDSRVIASAVQFHFVGLATGAFVALLSNNLWTLRRELYESQNVGRYRLTRLLGRGGMGEVWAAFHHGLRREVAVKILHQRDSHSRDAARRFEREIYALAGLSHPNTVRLYDFGVGDDGRPYYAMELLEGETVASLIAREGALSVARATYIVLQAAQALGEAHARGIVHRDAKPENLFVTNHGDQPDFVKVLDFGIASILDDPHFSVTRTGAVAGTPGTMSPEVILGGVATPASDVYALGAVFYLLLTGGPVFRTDAGSATLVAQVSQAVTSPGLRRGESLPDEIESIVLRCLERDPEERFASARELATALLACANLPECAPLKLDAVPFSVLRARDTELGNPPLDESATRVENVRFERAPLEASGSACEPDHDAALDAKQRPTFTSSG